MRIRISKRNSELVDYLTNLYHFKFDGIIARIAFSYSVYMNRKFDDGNSLAISSDGKDWRDERSLFGVSSSEKSNYVIYKSILDKYYNRALTEEEFVSLFKQHLDWGLEKMSSELEDQEFIKYPFKYLSKIIKRGLFQIDVENPFINALNDKIDIPSYSGVISLTLGKDNLNSDYIIRINDLNEFDSCNIAIAGMVGSGKTELVKDLLCQISAQSSNNLRFIFFDYKGEGDPSRLAPFLSKTNSTMVDLRKGAMTLNPLSFISLKDERIRNFNIKSFVDFVCTIATQLGPTQRHCLHTIISDCFEQQRNLQNLLPDSYNNTHPSLNNIFDSLKEYYETNDIQPDALYSIISDLSTDIFDSSSNFEGKIYEKSLYINLPLELSDTLRQLCVFLTLKYLISVFSSSNDTEPNSNRIKPLRYVIVIDEAHVYLKNKNASKALEEILRVLRSKGVLVIMLTQGVEDYKTKNFDFSSQIKIPICLNINNKDYKLIESFVGTPKSKPRLQECIDGLESQKGLINITEPKIIQINQFWRSMSEKKY